MGFHLMTISFLGPRLTYLLRNLPCVTCFTDILIRNIAFLLWDGTVKSLVRLSEWALISEPMVREVVLASLRWISGPCVLPRVLPQWRWERWRTPGKLPYLWFQWQFYSEQPQRWSQSIQFLKIHEGACPQYRMLAHTVHTLCTNRQAWSLIICFLQPYSYRHISSSCTQVCAGAQICAVTQNSSFLRLITEAGIISFPSLPILISDWCRIICGVQYSNTIFAGSQSILDIH